MTCKYLVGFCLILGGCMVGPNYKAPKNDVPDAWQTAAVEISEEEPRIAWWRVFGDPLLDKYIGLGCSYNNTLLAAEANILKARALRQVAASNLFPHVSGDLNATRTYFSKNGPVFAIGPASGNVTGAPSPTSGLPFSVQVPQTQNLYNVLFDATWEIDLFGKTRRSVEEAEANIGSAIETKNDTLISVVAEIARNYIDIRSSQRTAALVEKNIQLLEKNGLIVEKQFHKGLASRLDVENIEAELASARAALPSHYAQIYRSIYSLSILTGNLPEALVEELWSTQPLPKTPRKIAVGLRSDLLRRRPDVRRSERELASATAHIGVAVASFFPTVVLLGDGGLQSLALKNLFEMASKTWALGADIAIPIFEGGRLAGHLRASRAAASAATYTYQQTVLGALKDAEGALTTYSHALTTAGEWRKNTKRKGEIVRLSRARYVQGLINQIDFLTSKRELIAAEERRCVSDAAALQSLIVLYKALGGGWQMHPRQVPD